MIFYLDGERPDTVLCNHWPLVLKLCRRCTDQLLRVMSSWRTWGGSTFCLGYWFRGAAWAPFPFLTTSVKNRNSWSHPLPLPPKSSLPPSPVCHVAWFWRFLSQSRENLRIAHDISWISTLVSNLKSSQELDLRAVLLFNLLRPLPCETTAQRLQYEQEDRLPQTWPCSFLCQGLPSLQNAYLTGAHGARKSNL